MKNAIMDTAAPSQNFISRTVALCKYLLRGDIIE